MEGDNPMFWPDIFLSLEEFRKLSGRRSNPDAGSEQALQSPETQDCFGISSLAMTRGSLQFLC